MLKHGRAGVPMEVMGLMLGEFIDDYTVSGQRCLWGGNWLLLPFHVSLHRLVEDDSPLSLQPFEKHPGWIQPC